MSEETGPTRKSPSLTSQPKPVPFRPDAENKGIIGRLTKKDQHEELFEPQLADSRPPQCKIWCAAGCGVMMAHTRQSWNKSCCLRIKVKTMPMLDLWETAQHLHVKCEPQIGTKKNQFSIVLAELDVEGCSTTEFFDPLHVQKKCNDREYPLCLPSQDRRKTPHQTASVF